MKVTLNKLARTAALAAVSSLLALVGALAAFALPGAMANNPTPTCPSGYKFDSATGKCVSTNPVPTCPAGFAYDTTSKLCKSTAVVVVGSSADVRKAVASSSSSARVWVLSYEMARGLPTTQRKKGTCKWSPGGHWTRGYTASRGEYWFQDNRPGFICQDKQGNMRRVECGNLVRTSPPPGAKVIKHGIVVLVSSFGKYSASVTEKAEAFVQDWCGYAKASAFATASVSGRTRMQARGNARLLAEVRAHLKASARAEAQVNCGPKPGAPPPTTTTATTTVVTTTTVPTTTTVVTTTTVPTTTTTPPTTTTTPPPKEDVDLCINIDGKQTAVPAGYRKDPPDVGVPGNCYYVGP